MGKYSPYFIKVEVDPTGNENYVLSGTSQLLSVPYALYAGNTIGEDGWTMEIIFITQTQEM